MSKSKEQDLDVGRTLSKVRRHKGSGKIEARPRGKRSESYEYGYSEGAGDFIPESEVDKGAGKKKDKPQAEPKKRSRVNDPAPTPAEVAAVMKEEKAKLENKPALKPKRGRPKFHDEHVDKSTPLPVPKKKRGRPKGSKNVPVSGDGSTWTSVSVGVDFASTIEKAVKDAASKMSAEKVKNAVALIESIKLSLQALSDFLERPL